MKRIILASSIAIAIGFSAFSAGYHDPVISAMLASASRRSSPQAKPGAKRTPESALTGIVTSVVVTTERGRRIEKIVVRSHGKDYRFTATPSFKASIAKGLTVPLSSLRKGWTVTVSYRSKNGVSELIALSVSKENPQPIRKKTARS